MGDLSGRHFQGGEQGGGAVPDVVVGPLLRQVAVRIGRIGAVRSNAWIWLFSSMDSTTAFSGGSRYRPTTSRILASSSGSVENLNVSCLNGLMPHRFQILATVTLEIPSCLPRMRLDQWVIPRCSGGAWRVALMTSIWSISGSRPFFGRSSKPARPSAMKRFRHAVTVGRVDPVLSTISFVPTPSAASSTILARRASPAGIDVDRSQDSSTTRSDSDTTGRGISRHSPLLETLTPMGKGNTLTEH